MMKLWSCIRKELLLLFRDLTGLLVIFLMPLALVVVVTLVQENAMRFMGETKTKVLFLDMDGDTVGLQIGEAIKKSSSLEMDGRTTGKDADMETAKRAVAKGTIQFAVIVPAGTTKAFMKRARLSVESSILTDAPKEKPRKGTAGEPSPSLLFYFDPALTETVRSNVANLLEKAIMGIEIKEKMKLFSGMLPVKMEKVAKKAMGGFWSEENKKLIPKARIEWDDAAIMTVREEVAQYGKSVKLPNAVQQNVPAWTLFGMFFIVVPLAGSLIRERQSGMLLRLLAMPVSYLTIITGKVVSYVIICMCQLVLIMAVGMFLLPLLGTPVLDIGSSPAAILIITLSAALAASGYGILLGTVARTYEQASMFGAVSVVICAALGGFMVPVHIMPKVMQSISVFSPLSWGLRAFLEVFVRGGGIGSSLPYVAPLLLFFLATTLAAWFYIYKKGWTRAN